MVDVYRQVANRVGGNQALLLAQELRAWHDAMVSHQRTLTRLGFSPHACREWDDCAHGLARELWRRAVTTFGDDADALSFLRESAGERAEVRRA
jgi:hypothetical protein